MVSDGRLPISLLGPLLGRNDPEVWLHGRNRFGRALCEPRFEARPVVEVEHGRDLESVAFVDKTGGAWTRGDHTARQRRCQLR